MKIRRQHLIFGTCVLLGLTFLIIGIFHQTEPVKYFAHSLRTWQEADSMAGYPIAIGGEDSQEFVTAKFQPNLSMMSAHERYRLPTAHGFSKPTASPTITAAATGLVLYTGNPQGYPGKAVLLGHRLPNGDIIQTFYAGLDSIAVKVGQQIPRRSTLGHGKLYLEIRRGTAIDIAHEKIAGHPLNTPKPPLAPNRLPLHDFFKKHPPKTNNPDPLSIIQNAEQKKTRPHIGIE